MDPHYMSSVSCVGYDEGVCRSIQLPLHSFVCMWDVAEVVSVRSVLILYCLRYPQLIPLN